VTLNQRKHEPGSSVRSRDGIRFMVGGILSSALVIFLLAVGRAFIANGSPLDESLRLGAIGAAMSPVISVPLVIYMRWWR
jgi:O-antigen/teichoic acid export membrane protein